MTATRSSINRQMLLAVGVTLVASVTALCALIVVYKCFCARSKKKSNADDDEDVLSSVQTRNPGALEKLRHSSNAPDSNPAAPAARHHQRDDVKQLHKHSVYTKKWLDVVRAQRLTSLGKNQGPEIEIVRQNIQPRITTPLNNKQLRRTSSDQSHQQNSVAKSSGRGRELDFHSSGRSMSENKEQSNTDDVIENDVTADMSHGCQIQLVVSYNRLQQTIAVNIVRLFGLNSLNSRNKRNESTTTTPERHGRERTAYAGTQAVATTTDSLTTNGDTETASSVHSVYVGLTVLPDRDKCIVTTAKKRDDIVIWNEAFNFGGYRADQLSSRSLQLQVFTYDQFSRNEAIGFNILPLCSVDLSATQTLFRVLSPGTLQMDKLGELLLSLCYQPTVGRVTVVIVKARQLATRDNRQSADPYVKIWLLINGKKTEKRRTSVKERTTSPVYNESFVFSVPSDRLPVAGLSFSVADRKTIGHSHVIGHVTLGRRSGPSEVKHWNEALEKARQPVAQWHRLRCL